MNLNNFENRYRKFKKRRNNYVKYENKNEPTSIVTNINRISNNIDCEACVKVYTLQYENYDFQILKKPCIIIQQF